MREVNWYRVFFYALAVFAVLLAAGWLIDALDKPKIQYVTPDVRIEPIEMPNVDGKG